jgi:hypothetical protein
MVTDTLSKVPIALMVSLRVPIGSPYLSRQGPACPSDRSGIVLSGRRLAN